MSFDFPSYFPHRSLVAAGIALAATLLTARHSVATVYYIQDKESCENPGTVASSGVWEEVLWSRTCRLAGVIVQETDTLEIGGQFFFVPVGEFITHGTVSVSTYGFTNEADLTVGRSGTLRIGQEGPASNNGDITNQGIITGTLLYPLTLQNNGTITNFCGATLQKMPPSIFGPPENPITGHPAVPGCDDPSYPLAKDARICREAIAKIGSTYSADRHKAITACRTDLMKGKALFEDKAQTLPVTAARRCPREYKAKGAIAKAGRKARDVLASKCTDALLATPPHPLCGDTIGELIGATGDAGCLIDHIDAQVDDLLWQAHGY